MADISGGSVTDNETLSGDGSVDTPLQISAKWQRKIKAAIL